MMNANPRAVSLSRSAHRNFGETTKAFGMGLCVSSYEIMGLWGQFSSFADDHFDDVSVDDSKVCEVPMLAAFFGSGVIKTLTGSAKQNHLLPYEGRGTGEADARAECVSSGVSKSCERA